MQKYQEEFIKNLKAQRKTNKLTQSKLAELCNVTTGTIGNIECGLANPSFDLILKLADIFKIHPAFLFLSESSIEKIANEKSLTKDKNFLYHLENELRNYIEQSYKPE